MTPKNFFGYLRTYLRGIMWAGTSNKIFTDNVFVVPSLPAQQLSRFQSPTCFLVDLGAAIDVAHPRLLEQNFSLAIWVENVQSEFGEGTMLSACRTANTSKGAGLLDIEEAIFPQICNVTDLSSTKLMIVEKAKTKIELTQNNFPIVTRVWTLSCLLSLT